MFFTQAMQCAFLYTGSHTILIKYFDFIDVEQVALFNRFTLYLLSFFMIIIVTQLTLLAVVTDANICGTISLIWLPNWCWKWSDSVKGSNVLYYSTIVSASYISSYFENKLLCPSSVIRNIVKALIKSDASC